MTGIARTRVAGTRRRPAAALAVVGALLVIWLFAAEPFSIPTTSMVPTLRPGDRVLVDKLSYRFTAPRRGQLVVFHAPGSGEIELKRIVGTPGDRVALQDGVLTIDGRAVPEPYVDLSRVDSVYFGPVTVPAHNVFVMGDARGSSQDSRSYGPVPDDALIGRVRVRFWPLAR